MDGVLIVAALAKEREALSGILSGGGYGEIIALGDGEAARRAMAERDFDLSVINSPLPDESGVSLAVEIAGGGGAGQVVLLAPAEAYARVSARAAGSGVFVVPKPVKRETLLCAVRLAEAAFNKLVRLADENKRLQSAIEDLKLIDRAKCLLIERLRMTEKEAHKYIEKQAMDLRTAKKTIAENILKTHEM